MRSSCCNHHGPSALSRGGAFALTALIAASSACVGTTDGDPYTGPGSDGGTAGGRVDARPGTPTLDAQPGADARPGSPDARPSADARPGYPDARPTSPDAASAPARCSDTFSDVPASHYAHDAIRALYVNEITDGCGANPLRFCPDDPVLRRDAAVLLVRTMGQPYSTVTYNAYFDDIANDQYAGAINRLYELGYTSGCGTRQYCPTDNLRRDTMAVLVIRALGQPQSSVAANAYFDDLVGYEGYVNRVYELAITTGCGTRRYCPTDPASRAQLAVFLARGFGLADDVCDVP